MNHFVILYSLTFFFFRMRIIIWGYVSVKLSAANYSTTISEIEKIWKEFASNSPAAVLFP